MATYAMSALLMRGADGESMKQYRSTSTILSHRSILQRLVRLSTLLLFVPFQSESLSSVPNNKQAFSLFDTSLLRILVDIRQRQQQPTEVDIIPNVLSTGADAIIASERVLPHHNCIVSVDNEIDLRRLLHQSSSSEAICAPISLRTTAFSNDFIACTTNLIWTIPTTFSPKSTPITSSPFPQHELFALIGDYQFANISSNHFVPPDSKWLWYPPPSSIPSDVDIWKLRSNGMAGLILSHASLFGSTSLSVGEIAARLRRMKRPCSAVDYPQTIFMIGEDEVDVGR